MAGGYIAKPTTRQLPVSSCMRGLSSAIEILLASPVFGRLLRLLPGWDTLEDPQGATEALPFRLAPSDSVCLNLDPHFDSSNDS